MTTFLGFMCVDFKGCNCFAFQSCQFVVRAGKDYTVHAIDPDTLVDWDLIEQVVCS